MAALRKNFRSIGGGAACPFVDDRDCGVIPAEQSQRSRPFLALGTGLMRDRHFAFALELKLGRVAADLQ